MQKITSTLTKSALGAALLTLLSACGGGGGDSAPPPITTSSYTDAMHYGLIAKTTVDHVLNNESSVNAITGTTENVGAGVLTNNGSLSSYTISNGVNSFNVSTSGLSVSPGFASVSSAQKTMYVGGTTWAYSRFSIFRDKISNSNGLNTQYVARDLPHVKSYVYTSATPVTATYNINGRARGAYTTDNVEWQTLDCNVSVALTVTATTHQADMTFSSCANTNNGAITYSTPGVVRLTKTLATGSYASGATAIVATLGSAAAGTGQTFTSSSYSGGFLLGGPNAEELVGTLHFIGTSATTNYGSKATSVAMVFGAKK